MTEMEALRVYEKTVLINARDVDGAGHCRASALLGYLQDASAEHTQRCGCDRKVLSERYHVFWMLTRIRVELDRPIRWLDKLTIRTGHRGGKGVLCYRDYELWREEELIGRACALWVLPDLTDRKLLSATSVPEIAATAGGLECRIRRLNALHAPENAQTLETRLMRYSDTDVNGHVNNTKYADFACDAIHWEKRSPKTFLSCLEITYHAECMPGEEIVISGCSREGSWLIHGAGAQGEARFDVSLRYGAQG
jgi:acyl-ACP thioesterase